jgi:hypothetical protein
MSVSRYIDRYIDPFDLVFSRSLLDDPLTSSLLSLHNRAMNDLTHAAGDKTSTVKRFSPLLSADVVESENDYHVHVDLPGKSRLALAKDVICMRSVYFTSICTCVYRTASRKRAFTRQTSL